MHNHPKKNRILFLFLFITAISITNCASLILKTSIRYERSKGDIEISKANIPKFNIPYTKTGKGDIILLIHGFGGDKDNWTRMAPYLKSKFQLIAPDLPGFGESDRLPEERYSISDQVARVREFKEALGIKKFHLVGNSMGGSIAATYALKFPDDLLSLILIDSAGVTSPTKSELTLELEKGNNPLLVNNAKDFDRLMDFNFHKKPYIPDTIKQYFAERAVSNREFNEKIFRDIRGEIGNLEQNLSKIKTPTLILWGDKDRVIHPDSAIVFNKGIPNSKLIIFKDCGHIPQLERPEDTGKAISEFIKASR